MEFILSILRIAQLLLLVILTGLIGNVIATNISAAGSATAAVNFTMFAIVLSWLAALFGLATNLAASLSTSSLVSTARLNAHTVAVLTDMAQGGTQARWNCIVRTASSGVHAPQFS